MTLFVDTPLDESEIIECKKKFGLSYHVPYAAYCQKIAGFANKDVLEVGGSLPEEFVLRYLKVKSWTAVETPSYEEGLQETGGITHKGTILEDANSQIEIGFNSTPPRGYRFFLANIEDLPIEFYGRFDLIFSIAAFEHIQKLPQALDKMYSALKRGGLLFSLFSPIWSAHDGHHLPDITDKSGHKLSFADSPIPMWGHLLMGPPELLEYLKGYTDTDTAQLITYYVYNAPTINRFFTEDYFGFVQQSQFHVERFDLRFLTEIGAEGKKILESRFPGYRNFGNNGILILLRKRE
jgi:SAM-dependent methyltransferase